MKRIKTFFSFFVADTIFTTHLFLVLFVSLGWLVPKFFTTFLVLWVLTFLSEIFFGRCVLTNLEFSIRKKIEPYKQFEKSFITHYTRSLLGLKPRLEKKEKNFLQRNSFKFILVILLSVGVVYNYLIV